MILKMLVVPTIAAGVFVLLLSMIPGGKEAYWQKVRPVVSKYHEALSWSDPENIP